ncbi:MAG: histidinol-phosphate transaminase [Ignavibacteria bacterium]|nr:histidinol-phosphate transaminase [Ignavibacteria bacterium]
MEIDKLVRENIRNLKPYTSARDSYLSGILLDANENGIGSVIEIEDIELNRYPDPAQNDLRKVVGNYIGIPAKNLFFGVGSDEVIDLLVRIFCNPGKDNVITAEPTYGMYQVACEINDVEVKNVTLTEDFQLDTEKLLANTDAQTKIIFVCSPNNPTGNLLRKKDIINLAEKFDGILAVDEAYIDFTELGSVIKEIEKYNNLVVLRTFSKAWGLAGVRCGYCAASESIIKYFMKIKAPYNLNKLTRQAVINSVNNYSKKDLYVAEIIKERKRLKNELEKYAAIQKVFDSDSNFLLFRVPNAKNIQLKLAEKGVIIRDRSSQINLENCLRVTIGNKEENDIFLKELNEILK